MNRITWSVVCACLAAGGSVVAQQQPQQPSRDVARQSALAMRSGTSIIAGVVVSDDDAARPLRRVMVTVTTDSSPIGGRTAITDDMGRFVVPSLPAGRYLVSASKPAYLTTAYGATRQARPGAVQTGTAIVLADGETFDLRVRLARGAVVTGTVRDESGKPVREIAVLPYFMRRSPVTGERTLTPVQTDSSFYTNSQGVYRIYGIPPGDYVLATFFGAAVDLEVPQEEDFARALAPNKPALVPTPVRRAGYARTYFPSSATLGGATTITLVAGEEREGVDLSLQLVPNSRVEGVVTGRDGRPVGSVQVRLFETETTASPGMGIGSTNPEGRFTLVGVGPGSYNLVVVGPGQSWATTPVVANGDDLRVSVQLQAPVVVTGKVSVEGDTSVPLNRARLQLMPLRTAVQVFSAVNVPVQADGSFAASAMPGRYRLVATWPAGGGAPEHAVRSARVGSTDVADQDIEITEDVANVAVTFSAKVSSLSGVMSDASGRPAPEYFIIVFPKDESHWSWHARRIRQTRPDHNGRYRVQGLPPGDYLMAAVTDVDQGEWFDAAFLKTIVAASIPITLADGEARTQDIRVR